MVHSRMEDVVHALLGLDVGFKCLVPLAVGCWLLAVGCWLLAVVFPLKVKPQ